MNTPASSARPLAILTGASNGIGYQLGLLLAQNDYDIVATGRSEKIFSAAEDFRRYGVTVTPVQADLSNYEEVDRFWKEATALGRPIAAAIINAGIGIGGAAFWETDLNEELKLIDVNVTSVVHLAKRVVKHMQTNQSGRILFTSSISATQPTPYETVYGPSRAFVFSFAESLREELRTEGVSVTALLPGATDSDFHARAGMGNTSIGKMKKNDRVLVAKQGFEAMMKGRDHVVGGDWATKRAGFLNRFLTETYKASRQGKAAKP